MAILSHAVVISSHVGTMKEMCLGASLGVIWLTEDLPKYFGFKIGAKTVLSWVHFWVVAKPRKPAEKNLRNVFPGFWGVQGCPKQLRKVKEDSSQGHSGLFRVT